jgi:hypothetical protein
LFSQVRFLKSATFFSAKVSARLVRAFCQVHFLRQSIFLAKSVFSKGFGKFSALAFFQFKVGFIGKVRLVKNWRACKIKSIKAWFCFYAASLAQVGHTNKACT